MWPLFTTVSYKCTLRLPIIRLLGFRNLFRFLSFVALPLCRTDKFFCCQAFYFIDDRVLVLFIHWKTAETFLRFNIWIADVIQKSYRIFPIKKSTLLNIHTLTVSNEITKGPVIRPICINFISNTVY